MESSSHDRTWSIGCWHSSTTAALPPLPSRGSTTRSPKPHCPRSWNFCTAPLSNAGLGLDASGRKNADTCANYLLAKGTHHHYPTALSKGWPIATKVIERACRHQFKDRIGIIGARFGDSKVPRRSSSCKYYGPLVSLPPSIQACTRLATDLPSVRQLGQRPRGTQSNFGKLSNSQPENLLPPVPAGPSATEHSLFLPLSIPTSL